LFSLLFSFGFFTAINHAIGPQKNFGNLNHYIVTPLKTKFKKWYKNKCGKKPNDEEDNQDVEQQVQEESS